MNKQFETLSDAELDQVAGGGTGIGINFDLDGVTLSSPLGDLNLNPLKFLGDTVSGAFTGVGGLFTATGGALTDAGKLFKIG